ncbi:hypothetical protein BH23GEM5_BH23GEM5_11590 [soil metagenome]
MSLGGTCQEQVGYVGTGDQQDDPDYAHEQCGSRECGFPLLQWHDQSSQRARGCYEGISVPVALRVSGGKLPGEHVCRSLGLLDSHSGLQAPVHLGEADIPCVDRIGRRVHRHPSGGRDPYLQRTHRVEHRL